MVELDRTRGWLHRGLVIASLVSLLALAGCTLDVCGPGAGYSEEERFTRDMAEAAGLAEGDAMHAAGLVETPVLTEGNVLVVRLQYAPDENDEDQSEWYKVRLENDRSQWYDYVEWTGITRRPGGRTYDDYDFGSTNFNKQLTEDYYDPAHVDGTYTLTITGSNGYSKTVQLKWQNGEWTNSTGAMYFQVP